MYMGYSYCHQKLPQMQTNNCTDLKINIAVSTQLTVTTNFPL